MKYLVFAFILLCTLPLAAQEASMLSEQQKIDYLIKSIADLEHAQFIRNGIAYDALAAASHLTMKREKAGKAIKTVDDFIEKVASKSSMSGKAYLIRFDDGSEIEARKFYVNCLRELEEKKQKELEPKKK